MMITYYLKECIKWRNNYLTLINGRPWIDAKLIGDLSIFVAPNLMWMSAPYFLPEVYDEIILLCC